MSLFPTFPYAAIIINKKKIPQIIQTISLQDSVKQYNQDLLPEQHRFTRRQIILDSAADNIEEDIVLEDTKLQTQLNNYSYYWAMKKPSRF